jgi:hypothetical protein
VIRSKAILKLCIGFLLSLVWVSCGFQSRKYTHHWHWNSASTSITAKTSSDINDLNNKVTAPFVLDSIGIQRAEVVSNIQIDLSAPHAIVDVDSAVEQIQNDTLFPLTHQPLVYWQENQWNELDERLINEQLEDARGDAWVWVIEIVFIGLIIALNGALNLDIGWGFDSLARSIQLNNEIKRKLKSAHQHPLLAYWQSYAQWTSIILWIPALILIALILLPTILYIYG